MTIFEFVILGIILFIVLILPLISLFCLSHKCPDCLWGRLKYMSPNGNPYRRTCNRCGRREEMYQYAGGAKRWEKEN